MKKIVPDPPLKLNPTTEQPFSTCESSHPPVFHVSSGIDAADALVHASLLANGICQIADDYAQHHASESHSGLIWTIHHSAEAIKALTDAVLDAMER